MALKRIHMETLDQRMVKVYRDPELGEYQTRLYIADILQVNATYYTDSKQDAIGTADRMLKA